MDELSPGSKAVRQEANRQYAKASRRKRKLEDALADIDDDGIPRNVANPPTLSLAGGILILSAISRSFLPLGNSSSFAVIQAWPIAAIHINNVMR